MKRPLAIVTGASSGIGLEVARRLARRGYATMLIARRRTLMEPLAEQLRADAPSFIVPLDLTRLEAIEAALCPLLASHGPAAVLVNNAGVGLYRPFVEHHRTDHLRLMQVNYLAAAEMIRLVLPGMHDAGQGTVINIASMSSKGGPWGHAAYAASKAALVSLTQTLAAEYAGRGVRFSYVNPGIVDTAYFRQPDTLALWPVVRRFALPVERVADRIVELLDRPRQELCIPRYYRWIDWVRAIHPALAHRLIARHSRPPSPQPDGEPDAAPDPAGP